MTISTTLARVFVTAALVAAPATAAAPSPDLAKLKAHLTSVQTMTANFTQTDAKGRTDTGI
jgi:outer membrane lipoprotein-sorting protein